MFYKKISLFLTSLVIVLCQTQTISAFTIINQTDSRKIIIIQEAQRPLPDQQGNIRAPVPMGYKPHKIKILPKEIYTFDLNEPCTGLIVGIEQVERKDKSTKTTTTTSTFYEPYSYGGQKEAFIHNGWGIVIHKPLSNFNGGNRFSREYFMNKFKWEESVRQGYGIKCLHPLLLDKVTSLDELPAELN